MQLFFLRKRSRAVLQVSDVCFAIYSFLTNEKNTAFSASGMRAPGLTFHFTLRLYEAQPQSPK